MYCGDETGSFIGDIGSHTSRFGYGGDDSPKLVTPSYVARDKDKRVAIPHSCYKPLDVGATCQAPLRPAQQPTSSSSAHHPVVDPAAYLSQGQDIADFDAYEQLWQAAFDTLRVRDRFKHTVGGSGAVEDGDDTRRLSNAGVTSTTMRPGLPEHKCVHPLLAVTPGFTDTVDESSVSQAAARRKQRIQMTEFCMETLDCPAMFLAPSPMLAAFSCGRQTALVVDVGAGGTRVTPVVDGFLLHQAQRRTGRGGDWMSHVQWKALLDHKVLLRPRYQQHRSNTNTPADMGRGIFHRWAMQDLMQELRTCEYVSLPDGTDTSSKTRPFFVQRQASQDDDEEEEEGNESEHDAKGDEATPMETDDGDQEKQEGRNGDDDDRPQRSEAATFELPDGTLIDLTTDLGKDMRRIPELLFAQELPFLDESGAGNWNQQRYSTFSNLPLHQLIHASLSAVGDVDTRKDLANSILLTGGSSLFPGMEERLSWEVSQQATYKTKVLASKYRVERSYAAWIGGSILTSLGSFQQLWLGRTEYDEYGVTLALQRFP